MGKIHLNTDVKYSPRVHCMYVTGRYEIRKNCTYIFLPVDVQESDNIALHIHLLSAITASKYYSKLQEGRKWVKTT